MWEKKPRSTNFSISRCFLSINELNAPGFARGVINWSSINVYVHPKYFYSKNQSLSCTWISMRTDWKASFWSKRVEIRHEKQKLRSSEQILLQRTRTLEKQMHTLSSRLDTMEKVLVETINSRFEETNGFVFEVLTAMASTSSLSRRADEQTSRLSRLRRSRSKSH